MTATEFSKKYGKGIILFNKADRYAMGIPKDRQASYILDPDKLNESQITGAGSKIATPQLRALLAGCRPYLEVFAVDETYIRRMLWSDSMKAVYGEFSWTEIQTRVVLDQFIWLMDRLGTVIPEINKRIVFITDDSAEIPARYWMRAFKIDVVHDQEELDRYVSGLPFPDLGSIDLELTASAAEEGRAADSIMTDRYDLYDSLRKDLEHGDGITECEGYSPWIMGFWQNLFRMGDMTTALTAAFDYFEFLLRLAVYAVLTKEGTDPEEAPATGDIQTAAEILISLSEKGKVRSQTAERILSGTYRIPGHLRRLQEETGKKLNYEIEGDRYNFLGLCGIVRSMRNDTKGHGFIRPAAARSCWGMMLYLCCMLHWFLDVREFNFSEERGTTWLGWTDGQYKNSPYLYARDGYPCLLWEIRRGTKAYINYFDGEYVIPSIIEEEE